MVKPVIVATCFQKISISFFHIIQLKKNLIPFYKKQGNWWLTTLFKLPDESLKEAADRIALSNVQVTRNYLASDRCCVFVEKMKMKIALLNIIMNALESMHRQPGSILNLETKETKARCEIKVSDNGPGMNNETVMRIFEPYFTTKKTGNGLGMTNTLNIIWIIKEKYRLRADKARARAVRLA